MSQILSQNLCEFNSMGATDIGGGRHTQVPPLLAPSLAHTVIQHNMYQHKRPIHHNVFISCLRRLKGQKLVHLFVPWFGISLCKHLEAFVEIYLCVATVAVACHCVHSTVTSHTLCVAQQHINKCRRTRKHKTVTHSKLMVSGESFMRPDLLQYLAAGRPRTGSR